MNTDAVMCIAFPSTSPSFTPLSRRHSSTFGVMLINPRRVGTSNHSSLRKDFISTFSPHRALIAERRYRPVYSAISAAFITDEIAGLHAPGESRLRPPALQRDYCDAHPGWGRRE